MEEFKGAVNYTQNSISFNIDPYQPKTFSVKLKNTLTSVSKENITPDKYELSQNYPNPFNPTTVINYTTTKASHVTLKVYDLLGREIATLADGIKGAGKYSVTFDASKLSSGIYFYNLKTDDFTSIKKMMLIR
jgi:hypothetical protein